jgi:3',5'-cyclic AMP phosphodiesterase CpdA
MRTIAHLSDLHFGRDDPPVAEGLLRDLSERTPSVTVISGDFTQRARAGQFRRAAAYRAKLPWPQVVIPGNHDLPLFNLLARALWPRRNYRRFIEPTTNPLWTDEELAIVGIDSTRRIAPTFDGFWKDGSISREQLARAKAQLLGVPKERFRVVVTHHPFVPPPAARVHGIVLRARRALRELETCGADLLLAGHLHMAYLDDVRTHHEAVRRSMLSVQAGTAISTRRRKEPNAWNLITVEGERVTIEVRAWTGERFEAATTRRFTRRAGAWTADP